MKKILTLTLLMIGLISSISVSAYEVEGPGVPSFLRITDENGNTYVVMGATNTTCSATPSSTYHIQPDHKKYDAILSILLAAKLSGVQVYLRYECVQGTSQGKIIGVDLIG